MLRPATSSDAAAWIPRSLHSFAQDVGSFVPAGFESYVRILHPCYRTTSDGATVPVPWREIAAANGRSVDEEVLHVDSGGDPATTSPRGEILWDDQSPVGSLPPEVAARLAVVLPAHTETPAHCWFAIWEGWSGMHSWLQRAPTFSIPGRALHLAEGGVEDIRRSIYPESWSYRSANMWWPADRAWIVVTEIDFKWTYVGGSSRLRDQLVVDPALEVVAVTRAVVR